MGELRSICTRKLLVLVVCRDFYKEEYLQTSFIIISKYFSCTLLSCTSTSARLMDGGQQALFLGLIILVYSF